MQSISAKYTKGDYQTVEEPETSTGNFKFAIDVNPDQGAAVVTALRNAFSTDSNGNMLH